MSFFSSYFELNSSITLVKVCHFSPVKTQVKLEFTHTWIAISSSFGDYDHTVYDFGDYDHHRELPELRSTATLTLHQWIL